MSPTAVPDRCTTPPDENTWQAAAVIIRDRTLVIAPASDSQPARTARIMVGG